MSRMTMQTLLDGLAQRGLADERAARHLLRATLAVLGERLLDDEAQALGEAVPAELAECIDRSEYDCDFSAEELFERVRRREHTPDSRAKESAEIVLTVLGACLVPEVRMRIARGLPARAAELLRGEYEGGGEPLPHRDAPRASRTVTLAAGRSGSSHPLSEAAPSPGHEHSVALNPSPHGDTKLSGAKGVTA
jgi:uncharacterized protein (DUF2267 family)